MAACFCLRLWDQKQQSTDTAQVSSIWRTGSFSPTRAPASCVQVGPGAQLTAVSLRGKGQAPITVLRAEIDQN